MPQYTVHEHTWLIQKYFQTYGMGRGGGYSLKDTMAGFTEHFKKPSPTKRAVLQMVKKQEENGTVHNMNAKHSGRLRSVRTQTMVLSWNLFFIPQRRA